MAAPVIERGFAARLIGWQRRHGRHDLPWQASRDPYRIWLSEVMLQQTQVASVIPYYQRFIERFPDVEALARAEEGEVLRLWAGLGYYSRARNLHRAAGMVMREHGGRFPDTREGLERLPGLGRSSAAAIAAFAFGRREAILDGNVKRLLSRHFALRGAPEQPRIAAKLWRLADALLPKRGIERYTQALMDLGATVCTRSKPACEACPLRASCRALALGRVSSFPSPRQRKPRPERATTMLLLLHSREVLLEKRAPTGIWGGLWSLPEMPADADMKAHCARQLGCAIEASEELARLRHAFTHFTLEITALKCQVKRLLPGARERGLLWVELGEAVTAAVPAPVKRLLTMIAEA